MSSPSTPTRVRQAPTAVVPAAVAVSIIAVTLSRLPSATRPVVETGLSVAVLVVFCLPLLVGSVWLVRRPFDPPEVRRVVGWALAGAVPITVLAGVVVYYQRAHGVALAHPVVVLSWVTGVGAIGGFLTGLYDVRRIRRNRSYEETSRRLRALIEASPVAIVAIDDEGTVTDWSRAATDLFGWERHEVVGDPYPLVPEERRAEFADHLARVNDGETLRGVETERQCRDGSTVPVSVWSAPIEHGDGIDEHMVALADVSERKAKQRELTLLSRAIEQADDAVLITDDEGVIEYVNDAFVELFGYDRDHAVGQTPRLLKSGEHDDAFYADLWDTITDGDVFQAEVTNRRASGELLDVELTIAPVEDDGEVTHYVAIERDITERKRDEQRLEVLNRVLRHNVRNAVTVIDGNATRIADAADDAAVRRAVEAIRDRASELQSAVEKARTVQQALDTDRRGAVNVRALLDAQRDRFEKRYPDARLTVDVPADLWVQANATLEAAVQEALDNAAEHADDAPAVRVVATETAADRVDICVLDDGPGVPDHERRVLEAGEESDLRHGSGLGLWVMKWVVTSLGGDLSVEGRASGGTVVTVSLPQAHRAGTGDAAAERSVSH